MRFNRCRYQKFSEQQAIQQRVVIFGKSRLGYLFKGRLMKREVGLWIDHTKAVIVTVIGEKEETRRVHSNIGKFVHFSGGSFASPHYGTCNISGKGKLDREFENLLSSYYEGVLSLVRYADSIWIFGPGEAKGELEQHLQQSLMNAHIVGIESVGKMTDRQIAAKVRLLYQSDQ